jgi:hypothetical protein
MQAMAASASKSRGRHRYTVRVGLAWGGTRFKEIKIEYAEAEGGFQTIARAPPVATKGNLDARHGRKLPTRQMAQSAIPSSARH